MPQTHNYQIWLLSRLLDQVSSGALEVVDVEPLSEEDQQEILTRVLLDEHFGVVGIVGHIMDGHIVENGAAVQFLAQCFRPSENSPSAYLHWPEEILITTEEPDPEWIPLGLLGDSVGLVKFQKALEGDEKEDIIEASDRLANRYWNYAVPVLSLKKN